ncbi:MAG: hypothetical protein KDA58_07885, partial [Planctomycetaceae bacterium]|nr:hypothetical protein [Planctomycetaceae bacterium]
MNRVSGACLLTLVTGCLLLAHIALMPCALAQGSGQAEPPERPLHYRQDSPLRKRIETALETPVPESIAAAKTIEELAELLRRVFQVPVFLDVGALESEHLQRTTPITVTPNVPLMDALPQTWPLNVELTVTHDMLVITTETRAAELLETVVYDVRGLDKSLRDDAREVAYIIEHHTDAAWIDYGGGATMQPFPGGLVVLASQATHRRVRELLRGMMELQSDQLPPWDGLPAAAPEPVTFRIKSPRRLALDAALGRPWSPALAEAKSMASLRDALQAELGLPVWLDETSLRSEGVDATSPPVSIPAHPDLAIRHALAVALHDVDGVPLQASIHHDILILSTSTTAEEYVTREPFNLRWLRGPLAERTEYISQVCHSGTSGLWLEDSPEMELNTFRYPGGIAFQQTGPVLDEIESLLRQMHAHQQQPGYPTVPPLLPLESNWPP